MKFKHVKELLIGTAGLFAVGGMAAVHTQDTAVVPDREITTEVSRTVEAEERSAGLFAGAKLAGVPILPEEGTAAETERVAETAEKEVLQLARTAQPAAADTKEPAGRSGQSESGSIAEAEPEHKEEQKSDGAKADQKKKAGKKSRKNKKDKKKNSKAKQERIAEELTEEPELVIATVDHYLNVRQEADLESEVIGKLYNHSVGTLVEEAEDGWYRIESGSVNGYVKADYVLRGEEGARLAREAGQRFAEVTTTTLRVRAEATTESETLGLLPEGDILEVSEETEGWAKVAVEEGEGYVSTDYVKLYTVNSVAESKEEEEARLLREEEERRQAEEAARQEQARRQAEEAARWQAAGNGAGSGQNTSGAAAVQGGNTASSGAAGSSSAPVSGGTAGGGSQNTTGSLGNQIASYALQFVGNPYVYGGTSLTNGADCSGFVMSVYQNFGIYLPRTSGEQGQAGTAVNGLANARPGDLLWYSGHIGIYIGNGQIVHASSPSTGIKVSNASYRPILSIRRIV